MQNGSKKSCPIWHDIDDYKKYHCFSKALYIRIIKNEWIAEEFNVRTTSYRNRAE